MVLWEGVISSQHNPQPGGTGDHTNLVWSLLFNLFSKSGSTWTHSSMGHLDTQTTPPQSKL